MIPKDASAEPNVHFREGKLVIKSFEHTAVPNEHT